MSEGITDLESAFAEAASEVGEGTPTDITTDDPSELVEDVEAAVEQADAEASDQPEVETEADNDMQSLVDEMVEQADKPTVEESAEGAIGLDTEVQVDLGNGTETVTLQKLVEGNLRQADYTRKTQELAAQREDTQDAIDFLDAFREDPSRFAHDLAVRAGLIEGEAGEGPKGAKIPSAEEYEAEVERRVEERLKSDPTVAQATQVAAIAAVNAEFDRIADVHGVALSSELRQQIADEAARRGTGDLELVFEARMARTRADRERAAAKKGASTSRATASTPTAPVSDAPKGETIVDSVEEAFAWAEAQIAS